MKSILCAIALLVQMQSNIFAQAAREYKPVTQCFGKLLDLENGKTLKSFRQLLLNNRFRDVTDSIKPASPNLCIMQGASSNGMVVSYDLFYLPDDRIYEMVMSIEEVDHPELELKMGIQRSMLTNIYQRLTHELGEPTLTRREWKSPYSERDWVKNLETGKALVLNKLFVFVGYVSDKHKGKGKTPTEESSVYITLDTLCRIRIGVKDQELAKLRSNDEALSSDEFINTLLADKDSFLSKMLAFTDAYEAGSLCDSIKKMAAKWKLNDRNAVLGESVAGSSVTFYPVIKFKNISGWIHYYGRNIVFSGQLDLAVYEAGKYDKEFEMLTVIFENCLKTKPVKLDDTGTNNEFITNDFKIHMYKDQSTNRVKIDITVSK